MFSGVVQFCSLTNAAPAGYMPAERLKVETESYFEERTVGINRFYAALGASEQVDALIRVPRMAHPCIGQHAVIMQSDGRDGQYRVTNVQQLTDADGLKVADVTLRRIDRLYDVLTDQA